MLTRILLPAAALVLVVSALGGGAAAEGRAPDVQIDLATAEGVAQVRGEWRYSDARILETDHRLPGPDGQPTGAPVKTRTLEPRAGEAEFDDSAWEVVEPASLKRPRSTGRLCFGWYRIAVTVPDRIAGWGTAGSTAVLETVVDDYAEVWVDGEISRGLGQQGGSVIAGWNAPNRVVLARGVKPGQRIQVAVFAANGPLSDPPANFIWVRSARLLFYGGEPSGPVAVGPSEVNLRVVRKAPGLDAIVPPNPKLFKIAEGFTFTEGPVWDPKDGGSLLFSDPNENRIYLWRETGGLSVFRERSGYAGSDVAEYRQPGSNGLSLDRQGRLTANEHGNRRVTRTEPDGTLTTLADRYEGKRLNSPNDLVYRSDGALFFTDPPFGLPRFEEDPRKELPFSGVFLLKDGRLRLLARDLKGPNGIALSPDERFLYVGNWDPERKVVMRYRVAPDGSLSEATVFFDMTSAPGEDAIDGVKVDREGNLYVSGPGGLWVLSPEGKHLGTLVTPRHAHNMAWGGEDGRTLYLTAQDRLYRIRLNLPGVRP
jgi:gluconolactonase